MREAFGAAAAVDAGSIASDNDGDKIPEAIREARIRAVSEIRQRA